MVFATHFRFLKGGLALVGVGLGIASAGAQETATLSVSARVDAACTLVGGSLDFGSYTGDEKEGEGSFSYECTGGPNISLSLSPGNHGQGSGIRAMTSDGHLLQYRLFSDAARNVHWGEGDDAFSPQGPAAAQETVTVYGLISGGQDVPAGAYSDSVLITLNIDSE